MSSHKRYFINTIKDEEVSREESDGLIPLFKRRIEEIYDVIRRNQSREVEAADGGPYVGISGVAYMCFYLSRLQEFADKKEGLLNDAIEFIDIALTYINHPKVLSERTQESAYLLGSGGTVVVAALIYDAKGLTDKRDEMVKRYLSASEGCRPVNFLRCGGDELLVGRAGYLCGCLILNRFIAPDTIPKDIMLEVCKSIIEAGRRYSAKKYSPCKLMYSYYQVEYLGAGHGLSGILQMLLAVPECLDLDPKVESDVKESIEFLVKCQTENGNIPTALDELGSRSRLAEDELIHWCHGAPGVIFLFGRAYLQWEDPQFYEACSKCSNAIWERGLLKKGPGICHGISGSGYAFLLLYKLTGSNIHLHRARKFAEFMFKSEFEKARTPDCLYSLYEGLAGTVCFLADLIRPENAQFPLFDDIQMISK